MKIAVDLDGTAWFHTELFIALVNSMKNSGHEVGILTSHNLNLRTSDLKKWLDKGFENPSFYIGKSDADKKKFKVLNGNNGFWKASMVKKHKIDYLFCDMDGSQDYVDAFQMTHPFKLLRVYGDK